jgi:hypothetical protein
VASQVEPAELVQLLEFSERPRVGDWSLRAALTRYAQPQPQRVSDLLDVVRRIEFAMAAHREELDAEGPELWRVLQEGERSTTDQLVGLLRAMVELDRLGDVLAAWANDPSGERPDELVGAVTADIARRLDELGVEREERQRPTRARG